MNRLRLSYLLAILMFAIIGCGSPPPPPTPIPGYVAGEETFAYESFIKVYNEQLEECDRFHAESNAEYGYSGGERVYSSVDEDYEGTAAYVGGGIWRLHVRVNILHPPDSEWEDPITVHLKLMVEARSLPDRTWEIHCGGTPED